jgi:hypothetical protein
MAREYAERLNPKEGVKEVTGIIVGRDKKVIPPDEVFKLAAIGCKDAEIADWFGIKEDALRYNFAVQLLTGRENLKQSLRRSQLRLALSGNATMLIWLGKNILGQSEQGLANQGSEPLPWIESDIVEIEVGENSQEVIDAAKDPE